MERYPDEEANRKRFQALGWSDVKVCTMLKVFRALVDSEELLRFVVSDHHLHSLVYMPQLSWRSILSVFKVE